MMRAVTVGSLLVIGSIIWLAVLVATGFSLIAVSTGLLTVVYLLSGFDRHAA